MNTRANMGWDVPLVGHPAMGSGEVGQLIAKPENWQKIYILGFKNCSYGADWQAAGRRSRLSWTACTARSISRTRCCGGSRGGVDAIN